MKDEKTDEVFKFYQELKFDIKESMIQLFKDWANDPAYIIDSYGNIYKEQSLFPFLKIEEFNTIDKNKRIMII